MLMRWKSSYFFSVFKNFQIWWWQLPKLRHFPIELNALGIQTRVNTKLYGVRDFPNWHPLVFRARNDVYSICAQSGQLNCGNCRALHPLPSILGLTEKFDVTKVFAPPCSNGALW